MSTRCGSLLTLAIAIAQGCAPGREPDLADTNSTSTSDATTGTTDAASPIDTTGTALLDLGATTTGDTGHGACVGVSIEAELETRPADVVLVVDSSSSMGDENAAVMAGLNAFAQSVSDDDVDARIVLIGTASQGYYGSDWAGFGMCIGPPLGSGDCPTDPAPGQSAADSQSPSFVHLDHFVDSSSPLAVGISTYAQWSPLLRDDAVAHFVVVSDSDATQTSRSAFTEMFLQPDSDTSLIVHGVVPLAACANASAVGTTYIELATQTGGVTADLCTGDFAAVFDALSASVVTKAELPCTWELPTPPVGSVLDPTTVNVEYTGNIGAGLPIGHVDGPADCANVAQGWYYDPPSLPERIIACPQTCEVIQIDPNGRVDIVLGCDTIPAG